MLQNEKEPKENQSFKKIDCTLHTYAKGMCMQLKWKSKHTLPALNHRSITVAIKQHQQFKQANMQNGRLYYQNKNLPMLVNHARLRKLQFPNTDT